jgi:hypothetical protein
MIKSLTLVVFIYLLIGCENNRSINENTKQNIVFTEFEKDSILKTSLIEYYISLKNEDYDLAYNYLYEKIIIHMQNKFPNENIDEKYVKENFLKFFRDIIFKLENSKKVNFDYKVGTIQFKDSINNTLIYIVNTSLDATIKGKRKSLPSKVLCFSKNNGMSWQFMEYDSDITPLILNENFSNQITKKILNHF